MFVLAFYAVADVYLYKSMLMPFIFQLSGELGGFFLLIRDNVAAFIYFLS